MIDSERLRAYVDLIQELLSCPQGEEWILLRRFQNLVNPELVEVMEQVAHHLTAKGDIKAGTYLHNWAGNLHHILLDSVPLIQKRNTIEQNMVQILLDSVPLIQKSQDKTQAYIEFIQALLSCDDDCTEAEIIEANEELIDPGLIKIMRNVADKLAAEGDRSSAEYLHEMAADLNAVWLHKHQFEPALKPEIAADPWLDEDAEQSDLPKAESKPENLDNNPEEQAEASAIPDPQPQIKRESQLVQQLKAMSTTSFAIASSLDRLATASSSQTDPNPLWYMDVLEKAIANNWILSTDEVERLIGVKPHCHHDESSFARGTWIFTKAGKIGAQIGWKVSKVVSSS